MARLGRRRSWEFCSKNYRGRQITMRSVRGAHGFQLTAPRAALQPCDLPTLDAGSDEVIVQVAGCGVCHTDIAFAYGDVATRHALPLILGHEISGRVVAASENAGA